MKLKNKKEFGLKNHVIKKKSTEQLLKIEI